MEALKAAWEVRAGIIPGQPIPEYTKRWFYTSSDREWDEGEIKRMQESDQITGGLAYHSKFAILRSQAMDYHMQMSDPRSLNWAELSFIWY